MTKSELLIKWQGEMCNIETNKKRTLGIDIDYETKKTLISGFIKDIKNLSGETVKLREGRDAEHIKTVNRMFTCDGCGNVDCTCSPE